MDPISVAGLVGTVVELLTSCTEFVVFVKDFTTKVKEVNLSLQLSSNEINSLTAILEQIRNILKSKAQSTEFHVSTQRSIAEFFEKWATSMKDCDDLLKRWQMRLTKVYLDHGTPSGETRMPPRLQINANDFEDLHRRVRIHLQNIHMFLSMWNL
jgi:galactose-1-phosphate uridylyltransferase